MSEQSYPKLFLKSIPRQKSLTLGGTKKLLEITINHEKKN